MQGVLIHNASQLITLTSAPQRGEDLGSLNIIHDGAILIEGDTIAAIGKSDELLQRYPHTPKLDAGGKVVMPGFVDPHTHAIWVGDRAAEFEMRLEGKSYLEILAAGGGILSTVRATRQATVEQMVAETRPRLEEMFAHGTTTVEAKTGYGLELDAELRMLEALLRLDEEGPWELAFTFLAAHAVPPEYKDRGDEYTDLVALRDAPGVARPGGARTLEPVLCPSSMSFCETGAFSLEQSRRILSQASSLGFPLKIHADEFDNLGGASLAVELGAVSADHLVKTSPEDVKALGGSDCVAVSLPCTPFGLAESEYTPAKEILEAGGILALATDLNPGTAWSGNMQFAIALACRYMKLTPAQAIAAATINAAAAIDRADRLGSLQPGKQADLLILAVDDYRHLGYRFGGSLVEAVVKKGKLFQRGKTGMLEPAFRQ